MSRIKKIFSLIISVCLIISAIPLTELTVYAEPSDNMISNGTFDANVDGWSVFTSYDGCILGSVSDREAKVSIWWLDTEGTDWQDMFETTATYSFKQQTTYTIAFDAYATYDRPIKVKVEGAFDETLNLSTAKTTYKYTFTTTNSVASKLKFFLGNIVNGTVATIEETQHIYFDNIILKEGDGSDINVTPIVTGVDNGREYNSLVTPKIGYLKDFEYSLYYKETVIDEYSAVEYNHGDSIDLDGYYRLVVSDIDDVNISTEVEFSITNCNPNLSTADRWKQKMIKAPIDGSLIGAGDITLSWFNKSDIGEIKEYNVYVDDKLVKSVPANKDKVMSADWYSVDVSAHKFYIEAVFSDNSVLKTDERTFYITKKGLGLSNDMAANIDVSQYNLGWYYNWGNTPYTVEQFSKLEYVPMLWGKSSNDADILQSLKAQGYKNVLGYNEPELWAGQSQISVEDAISAWKDFSSSGLRVGSPATALCPQWSTDWFQPFMKKVNADAKLNVDFICIHHYWNYTQIDSQKNAALDFLALIDWAYQHYGKPIWITEFAIGDANTPFDGADENAKAQVYKYMKVVLEGLNNRDFVERYAWFSFDSTSPQYGASGLYNHATGEITELGKLYADMGNPEGYKGNYYNSYVPSGYDTTTDVKYDPTLEEETTQAPTTNKPTKAPTTTKQQTTTKPTVSKVKIIKVKRTKNNKKAKITLKKIKGVSGYKIQYSTSKKFKKAKTVYSKKYKKTITKLKKSKKYYIRAKAYKKVKGKKYYSKKWSKTYTLKVRKK